MLPLVRNLVIHVLIVHPVTDVEKVLLSQTFGGLVFAIFGGTPQIVLLTTAPLALYTKSKLHLLLQKSLPFGLRIQPKFISSETYYWQFRRKLRHLTTN